MVTWVDSVRGCCFIASHLPGRELYVDGTQVDSRSSPLYVGATVEFAVRMGKRGRLVVTSIAAKEPAERGPEPSQPSPEVAAEVWEGEGGAFR
jgi:hypothetical protein